MARKRKDEITFDGDDEDPAATQNAIDEFCAAEGTSADDTPSWTEFQATAMTGIPNGESTETPAPAEPAASHVQVNTEQEGAVHPEFFGVKYDEQHTSTTKSIQKVISGWPSK